MICARFHLQVLATLHKQLKAEISMELTAASQSEVIHSSYLAEIHLWSKTELKCGFKFKFNLSQISSDSNYNFYTTSKKEYNLFL